MPEVIDLATAAGLVRDGDTPLIGGSGGGNFWTQSGQG